MSTDLTDAQRTLTLEVATTLDRLLAESDLRAEQALAVLCSLSANIISLDPAPARQDAAREAFGHGLLNEVRRLRTLRMAQDPRYRAAAPDEDRLETL